MRSSSRWPTVDSSSSWPTVRSIAPCTRRAPTRITRGEVIRSLGTEIGLLLADLDLDDVTKTRATIPVLANRRF